MAPWVLPQFYVTLLNYVGLYSLVALGIVLLTGVAGQISFGQAAFVGVGAYATAVLTTRYGFSPWVTLPIALAFTVLVAWLVGLITLRMSGHFLPLGTIAWGVSLYYLFGTVPLLGGFGGLSDIPTLSVGGLRIPEPRPLLLPHLGRHACSRCGRAPICSIRAPAVRSAR